MPPLNFQRRITKIHNDYSFKKFYTYYLSSRFSYSKYVIFSHLKEKGLCKCEAENSEGRVARGPGVIGRSAGAGLDACMFLRSTRQ